MAKVKAHARWVENTRSIVDNTRTHSIVLDVETTKGGTDSGPTALELSLMSLAGCAITIFADVAKKSKIPLTKMEVEVESEKSPDSPVISNVNLKVRIAGKARHELLEAAWRRTEANCPVLFAFKEPIPIKVETEIISE
ncbi:MAG: OsmC family protein [Candidatus Bathyarchaeia archaeon]